MTLLGLLERSTVPPIAKMTITGSRNYADYAQLVKECDLFIEQFKLERVIVVSGGAKGADTLAERYARERQYAFELFKPDWFRYGNTAGMRRNNDMARVATHGVMFWNGYSKGTKHMITLMRRLRRVVRVVHYVAPPSV